MQRLFHVAAGADEAVTVDPVRLAEVRAAGGWIWLDVTEFTEAEVHQVGAAFGFDPVTLEDISDWSEYPKVDDHPAYTFIVGHGVSGSEAARLQTTEYDVFLAPDFAVTFHKEDLPGFRWAREYFVQPSSLVDGSPDVLWGRVAEVEAERFKSLADGLDARILDLEERAILADPSVPADVLGVRRDAQTLRQVIVAQREVFRLLAADDLVGITKRGSRRLGHVFDDFSRLAEILDGARLLLGNVLETYRGTVAERANEVMKVLTVFSAIVLPLSLIAGIYGMNFNHMPELAWRWGYPAVLVVMAVMGWGLWSYFSRRGFVGGPRLSQVPEAVGRGLVDLVKLTTKPATMLVHLATRPVDERSEE
ncbi:MAG: magnesium transporter CorA family protein [Actinomycetota bacterium]